ncbi:MAG TPA: hypothetical protein VD833_16645 [Vicinamibacterales bacterium]|nr:hypothetical protein [Vicinamibacterales bacterium]
MKGILVLVLMLVVAATAFAYGHSSAIEGVGSAGWHPFTETAALLLSGGALLGIAGAVRRLPL